MGKKYTYDFVKNVFEKEGYILLSEKYISNNSKLYIKCNKGHKYYSRLTTFRYGHRCPVCVGLKRKTIGEIKEYIFSIGYKCVSNTYKNAYTKLDIICSKDHKFSMCWGDIQSGHRCSVCGGTRKKTIEEIIKYINSEGYTCVSTEYINNRSKLDLMCPKNHHIKMTWSDFKSGKRCKFCYIEDYRGSNHPCYNHNLSDEERIINRKYTEYHIWRKQVYDRDEYICKKCDDSTGGNLVAHHIKNYTDNKDCRVDTNNGITFCEKCHIKFHKLYGYRNTNKEQLIKFLSK